MEILKVSDPAFKKYGKVIKDLPCTDIFEAMKQTPVPEDVTYVASEPILEKCESAKKVADSLYGGMPIEIGYCNGHNKMLNALEYHRDSEVNMAVTDLVLMIGSQQDITDEFTYDTGKVEAFLVPAGTVIEVFATTLHYAPCHTEDGGFQCVVVLPKGTNTDFDKADNIFEDKLLFARNKWLIAHEDAKIEGAFNGLRGANLEL